MSKIGDKYMLNSNITFQIIFNETGRIWTESTKYVK